MLNPSKNRLDYGNILHYGDNYELDFAIGATYSLELDALIGSTISLDLFEEFDANSIKNPIFMLKELRKTSNKIALFCESGQISCPSEQRKIYILLEDMVFPVLTSKKFKNNHYTSFHPKFWLIRYKKGDDVRYRVIILSRNLTFNRSWDISFVMDGTVSDNPTDGYDALISFIEYSIENSTDSIENPLIDEKITKMNEILDELKYVHFELGHDAFSDFEFIVNGVGDSSHEIQNHPLFKQDWERILIMTPFLSEQVISKFNKKINHDSNSILISLSDSFQKLDQEDCNNFHLYRLREEIVTGENQISEGQDFPMSQDIHAKIYVCEKNEYCEFYLGSLNASCRALWGNVELMIKLTSKNLTVEQIAQDIFNNGGDNPFEEYTIKPDIDDVEDEDEDSSFIIKQILRLNPKAKVVPNNGFYDIEVEFDENPFENKDIELCPLLSNNSQKFSKRVTFENLNKLLLSEFHIIRIGDFEKVIKIQTEGMPTDRQNEIISEIIKNKDDFIEYVALLFGEDYYGVIQSNNGKGDNLNKQFYARLSELYEKMLQASVYSPEKFDEITTIIESLSDEKIVPDGFNELYNTFLEVIKK